MYKIAPYLKYVRMAMTAVLIIFIVVLQIGTKESDARLEDVAGAVIAEISTEGMEESTNRKLKKLYGLNAADYEGTALYAPVSNMDAEELLIVKLKDSAQAETVQAAIEKRLQKQKNSFEGYGIEQFALLENSVLDVRGNYILYAVHEDADRIKQIFRENL